MVVHPKLYNTHNEVQEISKVPQEEEQQEIMACCQRYLEVSLMAWYLFSPRIQVERSGMFPNLRMLKIWLASLCKTLDSVALVEDLEVLVG